MALSGPSAAFTWPQEAARIEARLSSDEVQVRRAAAQRLGRLSPALARPLLRKALDDPDGEVRLAAARAAVELNAKDLGPRVVPWLHERDVRLRLAAVDVLLLAPAAEAIEPLGRALADPDARVRRGAAAALGAMDRVAHEPAEVRGRAAVQLLGRLDDSETQVRVAVVDSLARLGDVRAVLPLISKLQDGEANVRVAVARALGVLGDARATSALLMVARDRDVQVTAQAVRALGFLGDPSVIPSLIVFGQEPTPLPVRRMALRALGSLSALASPHQGVALGRLVQALEEPSLREVAEDVLGRIGEPAALPLRGCLSRATGATVAACARALAVVEQERAVEPIQKALEQGSLSAASAIVALEATPAADALVIALEHLTHPDPQARSAAARAVHRMLRERGGDARAAGPLLAALQDGSWSVDERVLLLEALGRSGDPAAAPALEAAATSTRRRIRQAALLGLGFLPARARDDVLLGALDDADGDLRRTAALSLRSAGSAASAHDLLTRLEAREGQDREAVALALAGPLSKSRQPAQVRRAATTIARLPGPARDSALEALVATMDPSVGEQELTSWLAKGSPGDRAKLAEALGLQAGGRKLVLPLTEDSRAPVRAAAVWSLGSYPPEAGDGERIGALLGDPEAAVAVNAAATVARWLVTFPSRAATFPWQEQLCRALVDRRPAVRVNAVVGLFRLGHECDHASWSYVLRSDPAEPVRAAVARGLQTKIRQGGKGAAEAKVELRRCAAFDRSRAVAGLCEEAVTWTGSGAPLREPLPAATGIQAAQLVFVVARESGQPLVSHPFLAQHDDPGTPEAGLIQAGWTDRRGAFAVGARRRVQLLELSWGQTATP